MRNREGGLKKLKRGVDKREKMDRSRVLKGGGLLNKIRKGK